MKTFLAQNKFYSDVHIPETSGSAAACVSPPLSAAAEQIPDRGYMGQRLIPALGTSVSSAVTVQTVAADPINHISEIFHYARKLMKEPAAFVLDEAAFMAEVEEEPLFIRDGEHLRRWA